MEKLPPPVDEALKTLASNLKTARLRRNLTVQTVADRIGVSRRLVTDAEGGKPSTGVAVYIAMLWALGFVDDLAKVASPKSDGKGILGASLQGGERKRAGKMVDADFPWPPRR
ncbi:MAG TPA: helix-turn-helix domain-containing protein [Myxococcales bacterium]|jgi:transcriptional regulator with XRE-family HTH domain